MARTHAGGSHDGLSPAGARRDGKNRGARRSAVRRAVLRRRRDGGADGGIFQRRTLRLSGGGRRLEGRRRHQARQRHRGQNQRGDAAGDARLRRRSGTVYGFARRQGADQDCCAAAKRHRCVSARRLGARQLRRDRHRDLLRPPKRQLCRTRSRHLRQGHGGADAARQRGGGGGKHPLRHQKHAGRCRQSERLFFRQNPRQSDTKHRDRRLRNNKRQSFAAGLDA